MAVFFNENIIHCPVCSNAELSDRPINMYENFKDKIIITTLKREIYCPQCGASVKIITNEKIVNA